MAHGVGKPTSGTRVRERARPEENTLRSTGGRVLNGSRALWHQSQIMLFAGPQHARGGHVLTVKRRLPVNSCLLAMGFTVSMRDCLETVLAYRKPRRLLDFRPFDQGMLFIFAIGIFRK